MIISPGDPHLYLWEKNKRSADRSDECPHKSKAGKFPFRLDIRATQHESPRFNVFLWLGDYYNFLSSAPRKREDSRPPSTELVGFLCAKASKRRHKPGHCGMEREAERAWWTRLNSVMGAGGGEESRTQEDGLSPPCELNSNRLIAEAACRCTRTLKKRGV